MAIVKDLGMVTAYAYAVAGGYEGTEAEFEQMLGQAGITLEQLENLTAVATTLSEGSEATASYSDGALTFGIPRGNTGATGPQGVQGVQGETGNGIASITKTGTSGLVDTYTITFTDGTTTTFTVTNGADGDITNVAAAFDATKAYSVGDMVLYQGTLYAFTAAHAAGAWVGSDAQAVILADEVTELRDDLNAVEDKFLNTIYRDGDSVTIQKNTDSAFNLNTPSGYIHVKATDNAIYTGKVNIIDLINLKQGTFVDSISGVTIEITGNEIYIHGTTTSGFRFNPQTGEFYTDSFTNHLADYRALPIESTYRYCFWEKTGYTMPSNIYIATRDGNTGGINANALSNHNGSFTLNNTYPQYFAIYANVGITDIDYKFTIGLKLSAINTTQGGSIEEIAKSDYNTTVIATSGYYKLDEFTWTDANNIYNVLSTTLLLQPDPLTDGHVYAWFGDSLSQLKELPNLVASMLDVTVYDCTFAGAPLTYGDPTKYQPTGFMALCSQIAAHDFTPLSDALDAQEAEGTNVTEKRQHLATLEALDFSNVTDIVLLAGTNDFDNDYVNSTNFVSGFSGALTTLLTAYPHLIVYVIAPPWRGDKTEGTVTIPTMEDLVELEKSVADNFCLPWYDLYHRSGINAKTMTVYLESDHLHPSAAGDELLANKCAKYLRSN